MDIDRILEELKAERDRVSRAIEALGASSAGPRRRGRRGKRRLSAEGRRRISEAAKRRWALARKAKGK